MAQSEAKTKWDRQNTVVVTMKLNKNTDAEIIEKLNSVDNKQGYIKELIKADIIADKTREECAWSIPDLSQMPKGEPMKYMTYEECCSMVDEIYLEGLKLRYGWSDEEVESVRKFAISRSREKQEDGE